MILIKVTLYISNITKKIISYESEYFYDVSRCSNRAFNLCNGHVSLFIDTFSLLIGLLLEGKTLYNDILRHELFFLNSLKFKRNLAKSHSETCLFF